jgi:hypothetical protein
MKIPADELVIKAGHLALRELGQAPEFRTARRLAAQAPLVGSGPRVAFFTPRSWASHVQWEGVLAQALRLRGASVSFLGCGGGLEVCDRNNLYEAPPMPCRSCRSYVRFAVDAHGFARTELEYGSEVDWPELDELDVDELYELSWNDVPLGALARIPTQWFNMTTRVHDDPLAPLNIRRFLRSGRRVADAISQWLDREQPEVMVLLNGLFFFESICWELCRQRDIPVVTYERGFVKGSLVFRRDSCACHFDHSPWWPQWRDRPLTDAQDATLTAFIDARRTGGATIDTYWDRVRFEGVERRRQGRLVAMFTNLTWDSAVIGKQLAFDSIHDWIEAAVRHFEHRPDDELVIRVHPAELKLRGKQTREPVAGVLAERFERLPDNVRLLGAEDPTSSYTLMEQADVGLVYTSTTGLELALSGTPTVVAGNTHYRDKGFTIDPLDPRDFAQRLDAVLDDPQAHAPDVELARRYAWLFFFAAPFEFPFVDEPRLGLARITTSDLSALAPGRHADLDRLCDSILHGGDFGPDPGPASVASP